MLVKKTHSGIRLRNAGLLCASLSGYNIWCVKLNKWSYTVWNYFFFAVWVFLQGAWDQQYKVIVDQFILFVSIEMVLILWANTNNTPGTNFKILLATLRTHARVKIMTLISLLHSLSILRNNKALKKTITVYAILFGRMKDLLLLWITTTWLM